MVHQALRATGQPVAAAQALATGWHWVLRAHDEHLPAPFRDSFLRRNAVNAALQHAWLAHQAQT